MSKGHTGVKRVQYAYRSTACTPIVLHMAYAQIKHPTPMSFVQGTSTLGGRLANQWPLMFRVGGRVVNGKLSNYHRLFQ